MMPSQLPPLLGIVLVTLGGVFLLNRSSEQARDTIRKHHLADIEQSIFFARELRGTFPPYHAASWCGLLSDPKNQAVRDQVEQVLRQQNNKYANPDKPFPSDPLAGREPREALAKWGNQIPDYFYWKRSPAVFELYATLEQDDNNERNTLLCNNSPPLYYDYGITSRWRQDVINLTS